MGDSAIIILTQSFHSFGFALCFGKRNANFEFFIHFMFWDLNIEFKKKQKHTDWFDFSY